MSERIELRISKEMNKKINNLKNKKGFEDRQDLIYEILENRFSKNIFKRLKNLF